DCEQQLKRWHAEDAIVRKLDEVSGIGVLTASALKAAVGQPERFANGRRLSAWLGMTPREFSSGERRKLGHISRQGNVYVRTLLIHGARAALLAAQRCQARTPEKLTRLQRWAIETAARIGHNKAAVALANKLVRICWAVWCNQRHFSGDWQSVKPASRRWQSSRRDVLRVVVVGGETVETGESCSGTRPITMLILAID